MVSERLLLGIASTVRELSGNIPLNDTIGEKFGEALVENTNLRKLTLQMEPILTTRGARCFGKGLQASKLERLELESKPTHIIKTNVLDILFAGAIQTIPHFKLGHAVNNDLALKFGKRLKGNNVLKSLTLSTSLKLRRQGATALAKAIRHSQLEGLRLQFLKEIDVDACQSHGSVMT